MVRIVVGAFVPVVEARGWQLDGAASAPPVARRNWLRGQERNWLREASSWTLDSLQEKNVDDRVL